MRHPQPSHRQSDLFAPKAPRVPEQEGVMALVGRAVREMFFLKSIQMVEGSGVHWFAGVLQSLCSPSQAARMTLGGEQRRKVLELLAPPPSRHDHSDGG